MSLLQSYCMAYEAVYTKARAFVEVLRTSGGRLKDVNSWKQLECMGAGVSWHNLDFVAAMKLRDRIAKFTGSSISTIWVGTYVFSQRATS